MLGKGLLKRLCVMYRFYASVGQFDSLYGSIKLLIKQYTSSKIDMQAHSDDPSVHHQSHSHTVILRVTTSPPQSID